MFLWRAAWNRFHSGDKCCGLCEEEQESNVHLGCPLARAVAFGSRWGIRMDTWHCNNIKDLVRFCSSLPRHFAGQFVGGEEITAVLVAILEEIWNARNSWFHEGKMDLRASVKKDGELGG